MRTRSTVSKVQEKMKEQARGFFGGKVESKGVPLSEGPLRSLTDADREAAMKKLHSYSVPLKDAPVVKGMKRALGIVPPREDVPNYNVVKALKKTNIKDLLGELESVNRLLKDTGKAKEDLRGEVKLLVELSGLTSVLVDKWLVTRTEGSKPRETIDRKKLTRALAKRGVNAAVIADIINLSTKKGKPGAPGLYVTDTTKPRKGYGAPSEG